MVCVIQFNGQMSAILPETIRLEVVCDQLCLGYQGNETKVSVNKLYKVVNLIYKINIFLLLSS